MTRPRAPRSRGPRKRDPPRVTADPVVEIRVVTTTPAAKERQLDAIVKFLREVLTENA